REPHAIRDELRIERGEVRIPHPENRPILRPGRRRPGEEAGPGEGRSRDCRAGDTGGSGDEVAARGGWSCLEGSDSHANTLLIPGDSPCFNEIDACPAITQRPSPGGIRPHHRGRLLLEVFCPDGSALRDGLVVEMDSALEVIDAVDVRLLRPVRIVIEEGQDEVTLLPDPRG